MKAILVIADGMADRPVERLRWKTPLESAHKPSLDCIAKTGVCGIIDPIAPGIPPGSDTATLALLGYDAMKVYSGRGALEALGSGVKVSSGDVTFRCNFATVDKNMIVTDRRAGRIANEDASRLAESLQEVKLEKSLGADFLFKNTIQHRAVLNIHGRGLSTALSDSDPGDIGRKVLKIKPLEDSAEARLTAKIMNRLMDELHRVLQNDPVNKERAKCGLPQANMILCRGAGTVPKIKPISEKYAIRTACVAATPLVRGVCKTAGMDLIDVKGATGTPETDYVAKAKAVVQMLKRYELVLLHVKATDVASHDCNPKLKTEIIERVDGMLSYVLNKVDMNSTCLAMTADHTTSVVTGQHEGDPVPLAITGPYVRRDDVMEYGERTCAKGGLGRLRGIDVMPVLMGQLGKTKQFGA